MAKGEKQAASAYAWRRIITNHPFFFMILPIYPIMGCLLSTQVFTLSAWSRSPHHASAGGLGRSTGPRLDVAHSPQESKGKWNLNHLGMVVTSTL